MCKIKIDSARPDLVKISEFGYSVTQWIVKGKVLADDCACKDKRFDVYLESTELDLSRAKIEGMVREKLGL